ncbi:MULTISPECIES: hypothetical protein [unclassified Microcoleus]
MLPRRKDAQKRDFSIEFAIAPLDILSPHARLRSRRMPVKEGWRAL